MVPRSRLARRTTTPGEGLEIRSADATQPSDAASAEAASGDGPGGERPGPGAGRPLSSLITVAIVVACVAVVLLLLAAPVERRPFLAAATAVAVAAGLAASAIGVFGGVLVPGLLLIGVDPRFAAPISLLLQLVAIPVGATAHYRLGNVRRSVALPLVAGGIIGSASGAFLASSVPAEAAARVVAAVIVLSGVLVLVNVASASGAVATGTGTARAPRIASIGLLAGGASGISGAGWGPIGVKLLLLSGIEPRLAIGSSLVGRVPMALAAVVTYLLTGGLGTLSGDWDAVPLLVIASIAAMLPGAVVVTRLGKARASAIVAILSIVLALPTLLSPGG